MTDSDTDIEDVELEGCQVVKGPKLLPDVEDSLFLQAVLRWLF